MFYKPPKFFVAHPVSTGELTFHQFDRAYKYVEKRYEIEQRNKQILREFPNLRLEPMPPIPRFTGDENENMQHIIDIVDQFYRSNKAAHNFDDENQENENIEIQEEGNESGYGSDSLMATSSTDTIIMIDDDEPKESMNPIVLTEEVKMTLIFSFGDICIHLVNGQHCDDTLCEANHIFPSREFILKKLVRDTPEQINKAYELVLISKPLKTKYLEVFNGLLFLRQD